MQEAFLHFIWQYQYFNKAALATVDGSTVNVIYPGMFNTDAGPDFKEAIIKIDNIEWRGNVELHINSADWTYHRHHTDQAYNNVVLHVVWQNNQEVKRADGSALPVVELQGLVDEKVIFDYKKLINHPSEIRCEKQLKQVSNISWLSMLDKVLMERLSVKAEVIKNLYQSNGNDWEETAYQLLARNFGFKVNSEPFQALAQSLPYKIIKKHADNQLQVEALIFGQAGLLVAESDDAYQQALLKEYDFLKHKYSLTSRLSAIEWRLLRLRPANFPMVRLAQFSSVLSQMPSLFQNLLEINSIQELKKQLKVQVSEYWQHHYQFGTYSSKKVPTLGNSSVENIAINTIVPLLVSYGKYVDDQSFVDKAITLLQEIKAEKNKIINHWSAIDIAVSTAFDSQALIQLYNEYCTKRKCLSCNVGASLIRRK
ncbi:DUF2851 family protein [Fulvivirga sp. 29W222]|uniref:DUF2851 family protein n=1 Tax=Fulvivirga marina TaxID=2494733 RepID=A0A937FYV9_9BACT|nr:DUF2851 family protein [Fulvivirga marina]MBL6447357.1 DUF2851 family protein [Fulvivirga marina]